METRPEVALAAAYSLVWPYLDERQRRLLLAAGRGGLAAGDHRDRAGNRGLAADGAHWLGRAGRSSCQRSAARRAHPAPGGGRKRLTERDPDLLGALDALVDPDTRGDPSSPLRWTCKSTAQLAGALTAQGHPVSDDSVGRLLTQQGYTLQRTRKTVEGARHPDRDAQFGYLNQQVRAHLADGQPVVSVDPKQKELVGTSAHGGAQWQPSGQPVGVLVHDFPDSRLGKAIPYGVDDLGANTGWVSVGCDHDTASFAVASLRRWWETMGRALYPAADRPLTGCWPAPTPAAATATGSGGGRPSWPGSRPRPGWR